MFLIRISMKGAKRADSESVYLCIQKYSYLSFDVNRLCWLCRWTSHVVDSCRHRTRIVSHRI